MDEEKDLSEVAFYSFSNVRVSWKNCGKSLSPEHLQIVFPLPLQKNRTTALQQNDAQFREMSPPPSRWLLLEISNRLFWLPLSMLDLFLVLSFKQMPSR